MNNMMNKAFIVLWFVVVCGAHPHNFKAGLQVNDGLRTRLILVDLKERHRRTIDQHDSVNKFTCNISEYLKKRCGWLIYAQPADPSLLKDPGFLANLEKVFSSVENTTKQFKKDDVALFTSDNLDDISYSNENNTGMDDRLEGKSTFHRRHEAILRTLPNKVEESLNNENSVDYSVTDDAKLLKEAHRDTVESSSEAQKAYFHLYFIYLVIFIIFI